MRRSTCSVPFRFTSFSFIAKSFVTAAIVCLGFIVVHGFNPPITQLRLLRVANSIHVYNHRSLSQTSQYIFKNGDLESANSGDSKRVQNVNFAAPLLDYGYPPTVDEFQDQSLSDKPILLYLPGFDGTYICPFIQFPELGTEFEVWCMTVGMNDRSTFEELKQNVLDFINEIEQEIVTPKEAPTTTTRDGNDLTEEKETKGDAGGGNNFWSSFRLPGNAAATSSKKKRPIYLVGESFGGILGAEVALSLLNERKDIDLKGLVLINPATCYDRSQLAAKGPSVCNLPNLLYPFGLSQLLPLFTDEFSFEQLLLILQAKALPSVIDTPAREAYMGRVAFSLPTKLEYMQPSTLEWRLKIWLKCGCDRMESRMRDFNSHPSFRTMIIAGEKDRTLPSIAEAERLVNLLPNSQVHVVEGAGHASTCGSRMDMTAVLRGRFPELQAWKKKSTSKGAAFKKKERKRTAMKPQASQGTGAYFGMEPRYDGADIGLSPLLYWSNGNFRSIATSTDKKERRPYRKIIYLPAETP